MLIEESPVQTGLADRRGGCYLYRDSFRGFPHTISFNFPTVCEQSSYPGFMSDFRAKAAPSYIIHNIFGVLLASNKHHSHVNKNHCRVSERQSPESLSWYRSGLCYCSPQTSPRIAFGQRLNIPYPKFLGPEVFRISDFYFVFWNACG